MTSYECFQGAARIESLAQEMYAGLAEKFTESPYLRQLFAQRNLNLRFEDGQWQGRAGGECSVVHPQRSAGGNDLAQSAGHGHVLQRE